MKAELGPARFTSDAVPIERALVRTVPWLLGSLTASIPLLLIDVTPTPMTYFIGHLAALVGLGAILSHVLAPLVTSGWFGSAPWRPLVKLLAGSIGIVVLVTGTVGLVTLASSAALRFSPSTQFLQLLSALDIAWVVAAVFVGMFLRWGRVAAISASMAIGAVCVWSIWRYLSMVGFGPEGEWVVSGSALVRFVLPFDVVAAVAAVVLLIVGVRFAAQATEQESPQS